MSGWNTWNTLWHLCLTSVTPRCAAVPTPLRYLPREILVDSYEDAALLLADAAFLLAYTRGSSMGWRLCPSEPSSSKPLTGLGGRWRAFRVCTPKGARTSLMADNDQTVKPLYADRIRSLLRGMTTQEDRAVGHAASRFPGEAGWQNVLISVNSCPQSRFD